MAEKIDMGIINKFNGTNYLQWKFQIKCALKAKGIYHVVDGSSTKPESTGQDLSTWSRNDAQAMFVITVVMDLNQITLIKNCESSRGIITKLDSIHQQKTETNKMLVYERFTQHKMDPKDSVA